MLARKTAVFKSCNGQHQRSENPNATPGHSQIFRKIIVMVLSGQKWHRNREKTDIYIFIYYYQYRQYYCSSTSKVYQVVSGCFWKSIEAYMHVFIGCLLYTPEGIIKWHFIHLLSPLSSSVAHHFLSILFSGSLNETL